MRRDQTRVRRRRSLLPTVALLEGRALLSGAAADPGDQINDPPVAVAPPPGSNSDASAPSDPNGASATTAGAPGAATTPADSAPPGTNPPPSGPSASPGTDPGASDAPNDGSDGKPEPNDADPTPLDPDPNGGNLTPAEQGEREVLQQKVDQAQDTVNTLQRGVDGINEAIAVYHRNIAGIQAAIARLLAPKPPDGDPNGPDDTFKVAVEEFVDDWVQAELARLNALLQQYQAALANAQNQLVVTTGALDRAKVALSQAQQALKDWDAAHGQLVYST